MRAIKFRAFHKVRKEMYKVHGWHSEFVFKDTLDGVGNDGNPDKSEDVELMRYIQAKDWRSLDIYEEDICVISKKDGTIFVGTVKYSYQMSAFFLTDGKKYMNFGDCGQFWHAENPECVMLTNVEILGNIYENPELLKD